MSMPVPWNRRGEKNALWGKGQGSKGGGNAVDMMGLDPLGLKGSIRFLRVAIRKVGNGFNRRKRGLLGVQNGIEEKGFHRAKEDGTPVEDRPLQENGLESEKQQRSRVQQEKGGVLQYRQKKGKSLSFAQALPLRRKPCFKNRERVRNGAKN